jgi:hypothetical protein
MTTRLSVVVAAAALAVAVPATASAAQIQTDHGCYRNPDDPGATDGSVTITGNGFTPNGTYTVKLNGKAVPQNGSQPPVADAAGGIKFALDIPSLPGASHEKGYEVAVTQGATVANATFTVSDLFADFRPDSGDPRTLRVRYKLFGFNLLKANSKVYLHYVKGRHLRRTLKLGTARGACGHLTSKHKRRLFGFKPALGTWHFQFDTNRKYRRGRSSSPFLFYLLDVSIRRESAR